MFDALYANRRQLEAMFAFFDKDKNGSISREEFRQGCEHLNRLLPAEEQLMGIDHLLDLIDFDRSNSIELNEFFEVRVVLLCTVYESHQRHWYTNIYTNIMRNSQAFRLVDASDGNLDGIIDLPTIRTPVSFQ